MSVLTSEEWLHLSEVMNGYIYSQALFTSCELGLFSYLAKHPGATQTQIQQALKLSAYTAKVLLLACATTKLIRRHPQEGGYYNNSIAEKVLVEDSEYSLIDYMRFNDVVQRKCTAHFTSALTNQHNTGLDAEYPGTGHTLYERLTHYPNMEALFQQAMGAYTKLAPEILHANEFTDVKHLLDVGGGDATNAIRLCQQYTQLRVSILDKPTVCHIAEQNSQRAQFSSRIQAIPCDIFQDNWPINCDAILMSHLVEIFSEQKVAALYQKAYQALPNNGLLFIWTLMSNDQETGGLQAAKASIYFLTTASGEGMAYSAKCHEQWLTAVGFSQVTSQYFADLDHGLVVAVK